MAGDDQQTQTFTPDQTTKRWLQIADQVEAVWLEVIKVADNILKVHAKVGFEQFADRISPSLDDILLSLKVVESMLDTIWASDTLDYSETRIIGNAKQQILWIQTIGSALKFGNETDYLASIGKLSKQSNI